MKTKVVPDLDASLAPWIGKTSKIVDYYLQDALQQHGFILTKEQFVVLKKLNAKDGLNQNELASLLYRDKSTMARLLAKMEERGLVRREQSNKDKRINKIYITEKGKLTFDKTIPVVTRMINVLERNITQTEKEQIINILKKVQSNLKHKSALPLEQP
ncbi:MarR family winged helix-turn-helix transcriptional regulator [Ulvibacterium sp.]|uniref:MarR family winged helix-turn-helix transcriptional regulator n=1 Tax=Ulvibacterium sp. TaxID=2665914 RepID=UPI003BA96D85